MEEESRAEQTRGHISHELCRIKSNEHGQRQCGGCTELCSLLRWGEVQRRRDPTYQGTSHLLLFHSNYLELDICATTNKCDTCQVIKRAFLLAQVTGFGVKSLENPDKQWPIYAVLSIGKANDNLFLSIQSPDETLFSATIPLGRERCATTLDPTRGGGRLRTDFEELRQVVRVCHEDHECSSKYRWSDRNPSWLLEILPKNEVRLVSKPSRLVDYVVLSYSWGDPATMPATEWARIKAAATKSKNGLPVLERLHPFSRSCFPEIMQDAITITESLGFHYIWIDSVCIPKGTNWDTEASLMHEVYGNAAFTLAASSATKATDPLLFDRLAWTHRNKACKLRGVWLHNDQASLNAVRLGSPVSQRGWTLQEERLSPRILYWAGQRWYWSCPEGQVAELSQLGCKSTLADQQGWSLPQSFLEVCRTGDEQQLHEEWLDIVESYTRRDLAHAKDRFLAIAGLAVRFYNVKAESGKVLATEEYLAGLWRDNFARQLSWSVDKAADPDDNLQLIAPSWSWASLPLRVHTKTKHAFRQSEYFQFIRTRYFSAPGTAVTKSDWVKSQLEDILTDFRDRGQVIEERGRTAKVVEVQGRFRRFISDDSEKVPWADVEKKRGSRTGFDFSVLPGRPLHARNLQDGQVVSKEAHGGEIVGQLDYLSKHSIGDDKANLGICLPDGAEQDLVCLELGDSAMLLLYQKPGWPEAYRRVGVCIGYSNRKGFFYGCETRRILLF
ncbi:heterokaryon incompatibility protein-domain-containing protein [Lasiosphaeris hirsuta]|uniref:Heterokaryon incompatibility protein-domain-containing protein n=1 Tax=Lasiosphaeris hirsuta TaxID=260670 RepID=A0AA40DL01_9PEZI|nr:heterokaryon incompatibility protein-domain-containing protein [Lasiosphaeris hirsuta]